MNYVYHEISLMLLIAFLFPICTLFYRMGFVIKKKISLSLYNKDRYYVLFKKLKIKALSNKTLIYLTIFSLLFIFYNIIF